MGNRSYAPSSALGHPAARRPRFGPAFSTTSASIPSAHCSSRRGDARSNCAPSRIGAPCPVSKSLTFCNTCCGRCAVQSFWSGIKRRFISVRRCKSSWRNTHVYMCTTFRPVPLNSIRWSTSGHKWMSIWPAVRPKTSSNWLPSSELPFTGFGYRKPGCGHVSMLRPCHGSAEQGDINFSKFSRSLDELNRPQ